MVAAGSLDLKQYCPGLITPFVLRISIPVATAPRMSLPIFQQPAFPTSRSPTGRTIQYLSHGKTSALGALIYAVDTLGLGMFSTVLSVITSCESTNALAAAARSPLILVNFSGLAAGWKM